MIMQKSPSVKTLYVAFHDAEKFGDTPFMKYEPIPIQINITHKDAAKIVDRLYAELRRLTNEYILIPAGDNGNW